MEILKVENLTIDEMVANLKMGKKPNLFVFLLKYQFLH